MALALERELRQMTVSHRVSSSGDEIYGATACEERLGDRCTGGGG